MMRIIEKSLNWIVIEVCRFGQKDDFCHPKLSTVCGDLSFANLHITPKAPRGCCRGHTRHWHFKLLLANSAAVTSSEDNGRRARMQSNVDEGNDGKKNFDRIHQRSQSSISSGYEELFGIICPAGVGGHASLFGQRLHGSEMTLCLFKGQRNQWPHFLRHGSDLSQWHEYQSRGGSAPRLAARRICLRRRRPRTAWRPVYLLSNVSPAFTPASSWPASGDW